MRKKLCNILLNVSLFAAATGISSLPAEAQLLQATRSHYSTDEGLASNAISYIIHDDYGYVWLATWNGLSRFDGYNFFNYKTGNASGVKNLHNRILDMATDNQQNLWLHMYDGRIFMLRRSTDQFVNPFEGISGHEEFRSSNPITVTSAGDVLVTIDDVGLYKMRMEQGQIKCQLITTNGLSITSMAEGYQNDIWLGTDKGVHRMDIANLTIERKGLFLDKHVNCLFSNGYNIYVGSKDGTIHSFAYGQEPRLLYTNGDIINTIYVDSHGLIWFSDNRLGVSYYNPHTNEVRHFEQRIGVPDYDTKDCHYNEAGGTLWIRMNQGGYGYYNRERDEVEYFHNDPDNPWNLSNTVNANIELNEGVVWESTNRRGLDKLEILKNTISRTQLHPGDKLSTENEIRALYYDKQRSVLLMGNKSSELFFMTPDGTLTPYSGNSAQQFGRIYGINKDSKGNYWLATKGNGLFKMTLNAGGGYSFEHYVHSDSNPYSLSDDRTYCTIEDKEGNIWIASYGGGVNVLIHDKNGKAVFLHPQNSMKSHPYQSFQKVRTLALDREGNVWAGTTDGILLLSLKNNKFTIKPLEQSQEKPEAFIQSSDVVCIVRDLHGDMWVGTNGGGLSHTTGKDDNGCWLFENFGSEDGLPSDEISSITFDNQDNVWFATDHVICSFNTSKRIFTTFSNLDGVDDTMCSEGAAVTMSNGNIIIGTINGYYTVDRNKLVSTNGSMMKLRITDFWLNDELQSPRLTSNYDYYIPDSREVRLTSHSDVIAFRFASLNYQLQHRMHYQYMLEGYDHLWLNADRTRTVSYSNLPTGHYRFKVKAFLLESPDKYDLKQIEIIVPPYFLLSSNAIWIYMAVFAALALWFMFWRQKNLLRREHLRKLKGKDDHTFDEDSEGFMSQLQEWLKVHSVNAELTANDMVAQSGMLPDDFNSHLRRITGMSPRDYLNNYRMKNAIRHLEETNDSIAEIAYATGFGDATTFTRIFRSKTGQTPSQYRDEHQKKNEEPTDEYEIIESE